MNNFSAVRYTRVLLLAAVLLINGIKAFAQTDAEYQKMMNDYKEKLKHVHTPQEGMQLLKEIQAKQQAYLNKKTDTATKIKNNYGTDQAASAMMMLKDSTGDARYRNNPMYTPVKVHASFKVTQVSRGNNSEGGASSYNENQEGDITGNAYMFKFMDRIVLETESFSNPVVSGSLDTHTLNTDHSGSHTNSSNATAVSNPLPGISLKYESPSNWSASCKLFYDGIFKNDEGSSHITPSPSVQAVSGHDQLTINNGVITIIGTVNEHKVTHDNGGVQSVDKNGTLTITITPNTDHNYTAWFSPVGGDAAFDKWLPQGYLAQPSQHGNYIDIKIAVTDASKPGQDFTNQIKYIKWELPNEDVSRLPGYANNAPSETVEQYQHPSDHDPISRVADMQLKFTTEQPDTAVEKLTATSTVANNYTIRVYCFDFGAFARLTAHVFLKDGTELIAKERSTNNAFLLLPKRSANSKIATYYKQQYNVLNKPDNADDEKIVSDDKYPGDGFTLYEEYRGWIENGKHIRGDPNAKEVMILDDISTDRSRDGIATYQAALNEHKKNAVITHHNFKEGEFGLQKSQADASELASATEYGNPIIPRDKWLNFNYNPDLHEVDQHGMLILSTSRHLGFALACAKDDTKNFSGTPADFDFLVISADFDPDPKGYATVKADIVNKGQINVTPAGKGKVITDVYAAVIAHEMMHYSGVNHHGNDDFNNGELSTFVPQPDGFWTVNGNKNVTVVWESNPMDPLTLNTPQFVEFLKARNYKLRIRDTHAQCSGYEDCLMRYMDADGYPSKTSRTIYIISTGDYGELVGLHLCTSAKGTGVNAATHKPESRYGDAQYGDCLHQYCINDKYKDVKLTGL